MMFGLRLHGWRTGVTAAVAGALLLGSPMVPAAVAQPSGTRTPSATTGSMYGGVTPQGQPLLLGLTADRRQLVRAVTVLAMTCTSGDSGLVTDSYPRMPVTRAGRFHYAFGPMTERNDDDTTTDFQGRVAGRLNDARTRVTGTWTYTITEHDVTGAVTDTCTSGLVSWSAKQ